MKKFLVGLLLLTSPVYGVLLTGSSPTGTSSGGGGAATLPLPGGASNYAQINPATQQSGSINVATITAVSVTASSYSTTGPGDGYYTATIGVSTYTAAMTIAPSTINNVTVFSSTNGAVTGYSNLTNTGSTVTMNNVTSTQETNVSSVTSPGVFYSFGSPTIATYGSQPWTLFQASGTSSAIEVDLNGNVSGAAQTQIGGVTIKSGITNTPFGLPNSMIVLLDSTTDSQVGYGMMEFWSLNPLHNDPALWFHMSQWGNSPPFMRIDANGFGFDMVNTSTDNAHGLGKWKTIATATQDTDMQFQSRAWDNSAFEQNFKWHALTKGGGIELVNTNVSPDGGVNTSSDTAPVQFDALLGGRQVGLTGPQNPTASYTFALPDTVGVAGEIWYNNGARGGNLNARQIKNTNPDFTYSATAGVTIATSAITSIASIPSTAVTIQGLSTTTILATSAYEEILSSGGFIQMIAKPTISTSTIQFGTVALPDGTELTLASTGCVITSSIYTSSVTLQDNGTLSGSRLHLGATSRTIACNRTLKLIYSAVDNFWKEEYFGNNP